MKATIRDALCHPMTHLLSALCATAVVSSSGLSWLTALGGYGAGMGGVILAALNQRVTPRR